MERGARGWAVGWKRRGVEARQGGGSEAVEGGGSEAETTKVRKEEARPQTKEERVGPSDEARHSHGRVLV